MKTKEKNKSLILSEVSYMVKNWVNWDKGSLVCFFVRIPALVLQPIITAYIPKAMIDCINEGVTVSRLTLVVALLSVAFTLTAWLSPFLQELLLGSARIIRMRYAVIAFEKNLSEDYEKIESLEGREKSKRAEEFYRSYYSSSADFLETANQLLVCLFGVAASMVLIYKINIFMIVLILLTCAVQFFLLRLINEKDKDTKDLRSNLFLRLNYFYELSKDGKAAKDIELYGFADRFFKILADITVEFEKLNGRYNRTSIKFSGCTALLNLIRESVAYAYLTWLVCTNKIELSEFIFYFGIITGFSGWIVQFVFLYSNLERCCLDCSAFREFAENESQSEKKPDLTFDNVQSVEFKNVSFTYPQSEKATINSMSFKIEKGQNIAIVGENGAGKTTAVKLLCGLYHPTSGDVLINGQSSRDFSSESFFELFSVVFQDAYFLPVTIAQNISGSVDCVRKRLFAALESAGISDKIMSLDEKENTPVEKSVFKNAVDFSGGEKQKLFLAKAIYKNAPVLILDEPTAALDPIAENELYLKYSEMTRGKISFFISHRLSSTRFCDRILFIKDGKISESGTHEQLMAQKGDYYRMYQVQSYYYKEATQGGAAQ